MWTSRSVARSSSAVGLISGSCPSARVFAPRFLQTPPRGDALALRYHFSPSGCEEDSHLQAVIHARRTTPTATPAKPGDLPVGLDERTQICTHCGPAPFTAHAEVGLAAPTLKPHHVSTIAPRDDSRYCLRCVAPLDTSAPGWMPKQWIERQEDRFLNHMYWHEPLNSWSL